MEREVISLDVLEKILVELKQHKILTGSQLELKVNLTQNTISRGIIELNKRGHIIQSHKGIYGGYEYKGYSKKYLKRRLTAREQNWIVKKYNEHKRINTIIEVAGISKGTVYSVLKRKSINTHGVEGETYKETFITLYESGYSLKEISDYINKDIRFVKQNIYKYIEANRIHRCNKDEVIAYINENPHEKNISVALKFCISKSLVSRIKKIK